MSAKKKIIDSIPKILIVGIVFLLSFSSLNSQAYGQELISVTLDVSPRGDGVAWWVGPIPDPIPSGHAPRTFDMIDGTAVSVWGYAYVTTFQTIMHENLTINKDTTYSIHSDGSVTTESTPGVNKVIFIFDFPPEAPTLSLPLNGTIVNATPTLTWNIPSDIDGDLLHFKVEVFTEADFSAGTSVFESSISTLGFSPTPPLPQGTGVCSYAIQSTDALSHATTYYWRVSAWDGMFYGDLSISRNFIVDAEPPTFSSAITTSTTTIRVVFSEDLDATTVAASDFSVNGYNVNSALEESPGVVIITLSTSMPTGATPIISIIGSISDLVGNLQTSGSITAADGVAPVITDITVSPDPVIANLNPGELQLTVFFSESMDVATIPTVDYDPEGPNGAQPCTTNLSWVTTTSTNDTLIVYNDNLIDPNTGDGLAVISVSEGKDLANNIMEADSTYTFVINRRELNIQNQAANPRVFNPHEGETVTISYVLSESAEVVNVEILDTATAPNLILQPVVNQAQDRGQYAIIWDGKDTVGQIDVPAGATKEYVVEVSASNPSTGEVADPVTISLEADATIPVVKIISDDGPIYRNLGETFATIYYESRAPGVDTELRRQIRILGDDGLIVRETGWDQEIEGQHNWIWDGNDNNSIPVPEGLYQYEVKVRLAADASKRSNPATGTILVLDVNSTSISSGDGLVSAWYNPIGYTINIQSVDPTLIPEATRAILTAEPSLSREGSIYEITSDPSGITFSPPLILIFKYSSSLDGNGLQIRRYDGTNWVVADIRQYVDLANNQIIVEVDTLSLFAIFAVDAIPPEAELLSPSPENIGLCKAFKGTFPIIGTITDINFKEYKIEYAPGEEASEGFITLLTNTEQVNEDVLAIWDTTSLAGYYTLLLTGVDLYDNTAVAEVVIYIGDPQITLSIGKGEQVFSDLNKPEGIEIDTEGNIYTADTNNDLIYKFNSQGELVAVFGEEDDLEPQLQLNKPTDIALDEEGNIYVADTNNARILKLSPQGTLLLEIGYKRNPYAKTKPGEGPAEFNHPAGIALDEYNNIYVADKENGRIQKLDSDGEFILEIKLDQIAPSLKESKPFGIALDGEGYIYVTDEANNRMLKFDTEAELLVSLGTQGEKLGYFDTPQGIAVNEQGYIYIADRNNDRIQKFDKFGNLVLYFGDSLTFNKPTGIAIDAEGNLYITDRNNNRIQKFGLPE